jgi:hypothetical protein
VSSTPVPTHSYVELIKCDTPTVGSINKAHVHIFFYNVMPLESAGKEMVGNFGSLVNRVGGRKFVVQVTREQWRRFKNE